MSGSSSRKRLACDDCTRKKIKCDKTVPCSNCVRKGLLCTRATELDSAAASIVVDDRLGPVDQAALTASLSKKVAELEKAVRSGRGRTPSPSRDVVDRAPAHPSSSFSQPVVHSITDQDAGADDSEAADAASILEFLAWGRRKDPDYNAVISPEADIAQPRPNGLGDAAPDGALKHGMIEAELSQLTIIQLLLPNRQQIEQLVTYHEECLLWYHGSFHSPSFRKQLGEFLDRHGANIEDEGVSKQWVALLFSVLTGSMCCAPRQVIRDWGFRDPEQATLSKQWLRAVITCLDAGEYMAHHSISAVEAIATLTISAHLLGYSNNQSVLLASAVRIAQSLGLHRLSNKTSGPVVERGRRVWCQLCTQDWFGVPFSESYAINPLYSQTAKPTNCHDEGMLPLPDSVPTAIGYPRFLLDIARLMPQLQDGIASSNTLYTKYEQVLHFDRQMRALATTHRPHFLSNIPLVPVWPRWVPWARRSLAMSSAHKIIMIHRSFLGLSFTNPAFGFTRRTCIAASKTILKEQKQTSEEQKQTNEPGAPHLWIYDAFSVAACVILCLDLFYRSSTDAECAEHRALAEEAVDILKQSRGSMLAQRGVRLVSSLLAEERKATEQPVSGKRKTDDGYPASRTKRRRHLDMSSFVKTFCEGGPHSASAVSEQDRSDARRAASETPSYLQSNPSGAGEAWDAEQSYAHRLIEESGDFLRSDNVRTGVSEDTSSRATFEGVTSFENLLFLAQTHDI